MILDAVCGIDIFLSIDLNVFWWLVLVASLGWAGLVGRQFCLCFSFMIYIKSGHNEAICSRSGSVLRHIGQMSQDLSECSKSRKISKKNRQKGSDFASAKGQLGGEPPVGWAVLVTWPGRGQPR